MGKAKRQQIREEGDKRLALGSIRGLICLLEHGMVLDCGSSMTHSSYATNGSREFAPANHQRQPRPSPVLGQETSGCSLLMMSHDSGAQSRCSSIVVSAFLLARCRILLYGVLTMASISYGDANSGLQVGVNRGSIYVSQGRSVFQDPRT